MKSLFRVYRTAASNRCKRFKRYISKLLQILRQVSTGYWRDKFVGKQPRLNDCKYMSKIPQYCNMSNDPLSVSEPSEVGKAITSCLNVNRATLELLYENTLFPFHLLKCASE